MLLSNWCGQKYSSSRNKMGRKERVKQPAFGILGFWVLVFASLADFRRKIVRLALSRDFVHLKLVIG
jgi:hypothetical protein